MGDYDLSEGSCLGSAGLLHPHLALPPDVGAPRRAWLPEGGSRQMRQTLRALGPGARARDAPPLGS